MSGATEIMILLFQLHVHRKARVGAVREVSFLYQ